MKMSNETYDLLKKIQLSAVPIGTFVGVVLTAFGVSWGNLVTGIIAAAGICLGEILTISSKNYKPEDNAG